METIETEFGQPKDRETAYRFLYQLQAGGRVNMYVAPKVLQDTFGFDRKQASQIFQDWADNWSALYYEKYKKENQ